MAEPSTATTLAVRPQPLGAFPLPAGYLLVPAGEDTEEARTALLAGRLPDEWPDRMRAHELAVAGDREGALAALSDVDPVSRYNRFVLDPDGVDRDLLRAELGDLGALVDLVSFVLGNADTPPELGLAYGEMAALVLSAQAAHALGTGQTVEALRLLDEAAALAKPVAPPLAGFLLGAAAAVSDNPVDRLEQALRLLKDADGLRIGRAELHLSLAGALHEQPFGLGRAIPHYHTTLQLVLRAEAPELWASAHANLAAAYLTMPMTEASDQLRLGVAVQSLRNALKVYTPETHPEQWASTQLNLANSLVYTPSKHQADNLVEAVELYEAVLAMRDRETDPLGRARVLANQGNVLAHLGMFDHAKAKLYEARYLFEEFADDESVRAVRGVLDEVARQQALLKSAAVGDGNPTEDLR
jgi:tetratricopeptide (TPR) repeat protein